MEMAASEIKSMIFFNSNSVAKFTKRVFTSTQCRIDCRSEKLVAPSTASLLNLIVCHSQLKMALLNDVMASPTLLLCHL